MQIKRDENTSVYVYICIIILVLQCVLIAICNFTMGPDNIDSDSAKLYVHAIEMVKNRSYIIPEWSIITTLELDCSLFFAVPIYAICKDIYVAFGIANMIFIGILIGILFFLFKGRSKIYPLLCANFILIPYDIGQLDYFNMMFFNGSQYIMKVLIPLLLIALLVQSLESCGKKRTIVAWGIVYSIFLAVSCVSSGIYIVAVGVVPVLIGYMVFHMIQRRKISNNFWVWVILTTFLVVSGLIGNNAWAANAKGNSMTLCGVEGGALQQNIEACFWGMFELFRAVTRRSTPVISFKGIKLLIHMGFVFLLLICAIVTIKKVINRTSDLRAMMLISVFLWNFFVLCITETRYGASTFEYRYHLIGMIPLICATVIVGLEWYERETRSWQNGIMSVVILLLFVLQITSYKEVYGHKLDVESYQKISAWCKDFEYENVYFYNDTLAAEVCRLLNYKDGNVMYLTTSESGLTQAHDYYNKYIGVPVEHANAAIVVWDFSDETIVIGNMLYNRTEQIDNWSIYTLNN